VSGRHRQQPVLTDGSPPTAPPPPKSRVGLAAALAAVLCLPTVAAVVVLGLHDRADAATESARTDAVIAARHAARDILSYDYRTLTDDIGRAEAASTGVFAKDYRQTAGRLKAQAIQLRAIVQASPSSPGVVSATRHQVVVLLFVDQASVKQVAGDKTPTTRIDQSRVRMTMTKVDGAWLVSQLDAL
jgi:Mce-associated membrane protein